MWKLWINQFWKSLVDYLVTKVRWAQSTWGVVIACEFRIKNHIIEQQISKEHIGTIKPKSDICAQINVIGEKVERVVIAPRLDRLPQQLCALVTLVRVHILNKHWSWIATVWCCHFAILCIAINQHLKVGSVPAMFFTLLLPESMNICSAESSYLWHLVLRLKSWQVKETFLSSGALLWITWSLGIVEVKTRVRHITVEAKYSHKFWIR